MAQIGKRQIKAWEKFNEDLIAFGIETKGTVIDTEVTLYEDALTTRQVRSFHMTTGGKLTWIEDGLLQEEHVLDNDDSKDWLSFWRKCLNKAKQYWQMDAVELDRLQDCETNDDEEDE